MFRLTVYIRLYLFLQNNIKEILSDIYRDLFVVFQSFRMTNRKNWIIIAHKFF